MQAGVVRDSSRVADVAVVIPVWQPDRRLGEIVSGLLELGFGAIIVVNDGSDSSYDKVFSELSRDPEVHVIRHAVNLGKGRALKTGLDYFKRCFPDYVGVVTADADGQHRPADIFRTAEQLRGEPSRCWIAAFSRGSDSSYDKVFSELSRDPEVHVIRHAVNLGKGRALKTGLDYFKRCFPDYVGVVTADADGQHLPGGHIPHCRTTSQAIRPAWSWDRGVLRTKFPFAAGWGT